MLLVDERQKLARSSPPHWTSTWSTCLCCDEVGDEKGEEVLEVVEAHRGDVEQPASARRGQHGTDRYQSSPGEEGLGETSGSTTNKWDPAKHRAQTVTEQSEGPQITDNWPQHDLILTQNHLRTCKNVLGGQSRDFCC